MRVLVAIVSFAFLLAHASSALASQGPSDDRIYDQVRMRLANDPDVKGGAISVDVKQGVVTLRGTVKQEKGKLKAERITKKVKGVKKVVNELQPEVHEETRPRTSSQS